MKELQIQSKTGANHPDSELFGRVVSILDHTRGNVVKAINNQMVIAYWLISLEIVQALQGGDGRAGYGKGFSATNLKFFRTFYFAYPDRLSTIRHPLADELIQGISSRLTWSHYRALMKVEKPDDRQFH